jgi:hypothetical protein
MHSRISFAFVLMSKSSASIGGGSGSLLLDDPDGSDYVFAERSL